jgi:hypothetical protein
VWWWWWLWAEHSTRTIRRWYAGVAYYCRLGLHTVFCPGIRPPYTPNRQERGAVSQCWAENRALKNTRESSTRGGSVRGRKRRWALRGLWVDVERGDKGRLGRAAANPFAAEQRTALVRQAVRSLTPGPGGRFCRVGSGQLGARCVYSAELCCAELHCLRCTVLSTFGLSAHPSQPNSPSPCSVPFFPFFPWMHRRSIPASLTCSGLITAQVQLAGGRSSRVHPS